MTVSPEVRLIQRAQELDVRRQKQLERQRVVIERLHEHLELAHDLLNEHSVDAACCRGARG